MQRPCGRRLPPAGPYLDLEADFTTSKGGAGAGHFERHSGQLFGQTFDVVFQATDGVNILRSECFSVTIK